LSRFLVRLANAKKFKPEQIDKVSSDLGEIAWRFHCDLKNLRISTLALEFDFFLEKEELDSQMVKALSGYGAVLGIRVLDKEEEQLRVKNKKEAIELTRVLFSQERYWECHEIIESIWREESDPVEKTLQQGVILFASALVHAQKNEKSVCLGMLPRSSEKLLAWKESEYYGLNIGAMKQSISDMLEKEDVILPAV
jgi:predicted metal-dependent hydrolase